MRIKVFCRHGRPYVIEADEFIAYDRRDGAPVCAGRQLDGGVHAEALPSPQLASLLESIEKEHENRLPQ